MKIAYHKTSTNVHKLAFLETIRKNRSAECSLQCVDVLICRHKALERKVLWQNEEMARVQFITGTQIVNWVGSVTLGSGKRKVFYGKTRKEVQEKLKIVLHDQQQGTLVTSAPQTVAQFLTDWLENTHRRRLPLRTYERYREAVYLHIVPSLGHVQLQKLTAHQVQTFYTKKADEGLAPATIIYYHSVLHNALDTAVKWGLVFRNVCDLVAPPRKQQFEIQPLTMEQMHQLLATVRGHKW